VIIQEGVTSIGQYAFYLLRGLSTGLTEITIPNSVTSIGNYAFAGCSKLTSVDIPNSVTSIGSSAFQDCMGLTSVTIPGSVTFIGDYAFSGSGLTEINVAAENTTHSSDNGVLFSKNKATLILYPAGRTGAYTIPNFVTAIGSYAFSGCLELTSVTIGNSVGYIPTNMESFAFSGCTKLKEINVAAENTTYSSDDGVLFSKDKATLILYPAAKTAPTYIIPNSVTSIGEHAFQGSMGLTSINIPNSVTEIGTGAFSYCVVLTSVSIPNSVASMGAWVFAGCTGLNQFINRKETPQTIGDDAFGYITVADVKLFVPSSALDAYKAANGWRNFSAKTAAIPFTVKDEIAVGETLAEFDEAAGYTGAKNITWTIGNAAVVMIENGKITAGAGNTAMITATLDGDYFSDVYFVNVVKGTPQYTAPEGLAAKVGQTLANVALPTGWTWMTPTTAIAAPLGVQVHKAKFTPTDTANYKVVDDINVNVLVSAATPINNIQKSDGRVGVRLSKNIVSDKAEFEVVLPNDKVLEVKAIIYDNTGNVVFETSGRDAKLSWNLTNAAGRNVANGGYLIIAEAKGAKGIYAYSAKVGVKR
jgi:hypothetical protein